MGNVSAAASSSPNLQTAPTPSPQGTSSDNKGSENAESTGNNSSLLMENGPGTFEDLHKRCKDVFPAPFDGAKLLINKGLSNHFQISHTLTMSSLSPSGYRFGCTFVGDQQFSPTEAYPVIIGDVDPSGNLNAQIIHKITEKISGKFLAQVQNNKWVNTQLTTECKGSDYYAAVTLGNVDLVNQSGVIVAQYLQNLTRRLALGSEFLYQYGAAVPGKEIGIYTLAGKYTADNWILSANITPTMGGLHLCYMQKASETLSVGVELDGSLRTQECTATLGYQLEIPAASLTFRGQLDSNWCVGGVLEKKLPPLPFTFALSGRANHVKGSYIFGVGLIVG